MWCEVTVAYLTVLPQNSFGRIEENHNSFKQNSRFPGHSSRQEFSNTMQRSYIFGTEDADSRLLGNVAIHLSIYTWTHTSEDYKLAIYCRENLKHTGLLHQ
jgi:hypothetical protein